MKPLFVSRVMENCALYKDKPALVRADDGQTITYADLGRHIAGARQALREAGVLKGSRVMLAASRSFDFIFLYLALHSLGAVAIPLDPALPAERCLAIREQTGPVLRVWPDGAMPHSRSYGDFSRRGEEPIEVQAEPADIADIMFTSGTTGKPKGVLLTHANIEAAVRNINMFIGNGADDRELCPMPLSHSFGLARIRCNLFAGGTLILEDGIARPKRLFQSLANYRTTGLSMVAAAWTILARISGDKISEYGAGLKYFELGSAPISAAAKAELARLLPGAKVCMHYGLTEASRAVFLDFRADAANLASVGKASPLCEISIRAADGGELGTGEEGEICLKGPIVCKGYLEEEQSRAAFHGDFFRTGDLGRLDANGYLFLTGRIKEIINVAGEKVSPREIEEELEAFPGVSEAGCCAMPDALLGEAVAAFIAPEAGREPDPEAIAAALKGRLEAHKRPRLIKIINALPRTISGKIRRAALKEML